MANKFWVLGSGVLDGSTTTHISDSSGGAGGAVYPSSSDTLIFDANSGGGTVTFTASASFAGITSGAHTGTLDTNDQTVTLSGTFSIGGTGTRTVDLGASAISCTGWTAASDANLTFIPGTSTITMTGNGVFTGNSKTYSTAVFTDSPLLTGANTFANLTFTGPASKTGNPWLGADQTVTGTVTINGNSTTNRVLISSNIKGTARTITAAAISMSNVDLQDITAAGASAPWNLSAITGLSGDAGGNSNITFTSPQTNYAIGTGSRSASTASMWSLTTGGGATGRVPLPQDSAIVDANSGTGTITQNMPRTGGWDFTGSSGITWTTNTTASFFGSINLTGLGTLTGSTQTYIYEGRGSSTLTSAGNSWAKPLNVDAPGGTLTLGDAFTTTTASTALTLGTGGTFNDGGFNVTGTRVTAGTGGSSPFLTGSGTWSLSGTPTSTPINLTFATVSGTITFRLVGTMTQAGAIVIGTGKTFYRLEIATTGAFAHQFQGSNTFSNGIYIDASAAARTVQFTAGTTTTVGDFTRDSGTNVITIGSITSASHTLTKSGGGTIIFPYANISYSTATPGSTWYAGNSTDSGHNSGWSFVLLSAGTTAYSEWTNEAADATCTFNGVLASTIATWVADDKTALSTFTSDGDTAYSSWQAPSKTATWSFAGSATTVFSTWTAPSKSSSSSISRNLTTAKATWYTGPRAQALSTFTSDGESAVSDWVTSDLDSLIRVLVNIQIPVSLAAARDITVSVPAAREIPVSWSE